MDKLALALLVLHDRLCEVAAAAAEEAAAVAALRLHVTPTTRCPRHALLELDNIGF